MSSLFTLLVTIVIGYLLLTGWVYMSQDGMVYLPSSRLEATPEAIGLEYEDVWLDAADGVAIHAWFVPAKAEGQRVVLFCHGNAGNISHRLDSLRIFHELGISVLIFDYRGYGQSHGRPSEKGAYLDAQAAWEHLVAVRNFKPGEIIVFGRSLGGAVASHLAAQNQASALILESTFTSLPDIGAKLYPYLPVRLLAKHRYDNLEHLRSVSCPVLVVHSPGDEIIPFAHGKTLFAAAPEPKAFLEISGGHNHGFLITGDAYVDGLRQFIEKSYHDVFSGMNMPVGSKP